MEPATNGTNDSSHVACNSKLNDQEQFPPVFIFILHSTQVLLSLSAIFANFFVTTVLYFKDKLSATELLVFIHSLLDGSYGLYLFTGAAGSLLNIFDRIKCSYPSFLCIYTYGLHTFFVFSSLILALTITINRYIAVERPFDYKIWCTRFRTGLIVLGAGVMGLLTTVPEVALCVGDAGFTSGWEDVYVVYWYCARSGLTIICCCASALLFRSISKQFSKSTWLSTLLPFKYQRSVLCRFNNAKAQHNGEGTSPSVSIVVPKNEVEMKEKKKGEANDSKEGTNKERAIEIIAVKGQRKADAKDESCVDSVAEVHPNISDDKCNHAYSRERPRFPSVVDTTRNYSVTEITLSVPISNMKSSLATERSGSLMASANGPGSGKDGAQKTGKHLNQKNARPNDRSKFPGSQNGVNQGNSSSSSSADSKKRVTATLFYVTVFFIIISTPVAIAELFQNVFGFINLSPVASEILTLSTETLFCANFFLSAYLFIFNNSYIHEKLRSWKLCMR